MGKILVELRSAEGGDDSKLLVKSRVCSKCKATKHVSEFYSRPNRASGVYSCCKSCKSKCRSERYYERRAEDPVSLWVANSRNWASDRAKKKRIEFSLTKDDVMNALSESGYFCVYCGIEFNFQRSTATRRDSPTIDRLIPSCGYVPKNIVVCCYRCNALKGDSYPDELRKIADAAELFIASRK